MTTAVATVKPLSPKQARFVDEYLVDMNAAQAAIRAGYAAKNADVTGPNADGRERGRSDMGGQIKSRLRQMRAVIEPRDAAPAGGGECRLVLVTRDWTVELGVLVGPVTRPILVHQVAGRGR